MVTIGRGTYITVFREREGGIHKNTNLKKFFKENEQFCNK